MPDAGLPPLLIRVAAGFSLLVAIWIVVGIGVRLAYTDQILPRTSMAGLQLGGLSVNEAEQRLATALASQSPVAMTAAGRRFAVQPEAVRYRIDIAASARRAHDAGRRGAASVLWSPLASLLAPRRLEPVARIDAVRLAAQIAAIARTVDRPARAGTIRVDDTAPAGLRVTAPRAQRTLRRAVARELLLSALADRRADPVALPVRTQRGATSDQVQSVTQRARQYLRTPLQLSAGSRTRTLTRRQTAGLLALRPLSGTRSGALTLGIDSSAAARLIDDLAQDLDRASADARISAPSRPPVTVEGQGDLSWRPRNADVSVRPATQGRRLRRTLAMAALTEAVRRGRHRIALSFTLADAAVTTAAARDVTSLIGTFTTHYPCCPPRVTNIRLIAKAIDGSVVMPGQRFSLNDSTGERRRADGYLKAPFIADGELAESVGGGVSQVSTTLYNAAYFAGLRIDVHQPHSFYIDRYPPGREATLNFPDIDLRWTNDTSAPVLIRAATDDTSVTVSLYGGDSQRRVRAQTGGRKPVQDGDFAITVTRVLRFRDGNILRQPYTTRYDRPPAAE